jgi:hypothetical protein
MRNGRSPAAQVLVDEHRCKQMELENGSAGSSRAIVLLRKCTGGSPFDRAADDFSGHAIHAAN